ncbi:hypothetical protein HN014_10625 [Aquimarina sp. TRL1]|nr:hypothetical protein [Aquimarina sp. TRL1]QKX07587.1 hypothetical protein HN014_10625 [Aquimarina sp. TRL1]
MDKTVIIITSVGLAIGFAEALIYYNLGTNANKKKFKFGVPKGKQLVKNMGVVLATSALTAILSYKIEQSFKS